MKNLLSFVILLLGKPFVVKGTSSHDKEHQVAPIVLSQIPTNFRRYSGTVMAILLTIREALANAVSFANKNVDPEVRIWWIKLSSGALYMVIAHNGLSFKKEADLYQKGLTPLQSDNIDHSFNGAGLGFSASMLREDGELVILSQINSKWVGYKGFPNRADNQWCAQNCTDEWNKILKNHFGTRINDFNVIYAFRLDETREKQLRLNESDMNMLPFMCPKFIGKGKNHRWSPIGSVRVYFNTRFLEPNEKYEWGGHGGSERRILPTLAEFLESYQDREFPLICTPFEWEIKGEKFRLAMKITARAFPTEQDPGCGWLKRIRDAIDGEFKKGSTSSPGKKPRRQVYFTISCASKEGGKKFARFADNTVWTNDHIAEYMNACGFQHRGVGSKFSTLHFDIIGVEKENENGKYVPVNPMILAARLEREADFTCRATQDIRDITTEACSHIDENVVYQRAVECFKEMFPLEESDLVDLFVEDFGVIKPKEQVFEVFDLTTGLPLLRTCSAGDQHCIAITRKMKTGKARRVRLAEIAIPPGLETSFSITEPKRLTAKNRENIAEIEKELGIKLEPLQVEISFPEFRANPDADWQPIKRMKQQYQIGSANCRPRRSLGVRIGDERLHLFTLDDIPARPTREVEVAGGSDATNNTSHDSGGQYRCQVDIYCERPEEYIFGEFRQKESLWRPNKLVPSVRKLFSGRDPRVQAAIRKLYQYFNARANSLKNAMQAVKFNSYEFLQDRGSESLGWHPDDRYDYAMNMLWKDFIEIDPAGKELIDDINKLKAKYEGATEDVELV